MQEKKKAPSCEEIIHHPPVARSLDVIVIKQIFKICGGKHNSSTHVSWMMAQFQMFLAIRHFPTKRSFYSLVGREGQGDKSTTMWECTC